MSPKIFLFAGVVLSVVGCASNQPQSTTTYILGGPKNPEQLSPDIYHKGAFSEPEPVIREGRYRIVSTRPSAEQRDLLAQIIQFQTTNPYANVKTALTRVTAGSGYRLCTGAPDGTVDTLYKLPLPKAHRNIGPVTLRNALQVLAGPAYKVEVDEARRGICFKVRSDYIEAKLITHKQTSPPLTNEAKK